MEFQNVEDKVKRLEYLDIEGLDYKFPLRVTMSEWELLSDPFKKGSLHSLTCHPLFTMSSWVAPFDDWDYCDVYEIALRYRYPKYAVFGPHKTRGLAQKKALKFLIEHHAVEILER